jgi:Flp pilus assembly protein TadD
MRRRLLVTVVAVLTAWAPTLFAADRPDAVFGYEAWRHAVEQRGLDPDAVVYPFSVTPEMEVWADAAVAVGHTTQPLERLVLLQTAMFEDGGFDFTYDDRRTLTAGEAFTARRGNCLSFTALFVAMSRNLGIATYLMSVQRQPEVGREDGLVIVSRHVVAAFTSGAQVSTFDFYRSSATHLERRTVVDDLEASAMYHNNLGGAALRADDLDGAVRHLEITTTLAPEWSPGWINLGVTLARLDDSDGAFRALNRALEIDPGNSSALNNLSILYDRLGRDDEALAALRAAAATTHNPFTLVAMADFELVGGNLREASGYLKRARRYHPDEPVVYDGLARLAGQRGQTNRQAKYAAKAARLRAGEGGGG